MAGFGRFWLRNGAVRARRNMVAPVAGRADSRRDRDRRASNIFLLGAEANTSCVTIRFENAPSRPHAMRTYQKPPISDYNAFRVGWLYCRTNAGKPRQVAMYYARRRRDISQPWFASNTTLSCIFRTRRARARSCEEPRVQAGQEQGHAESRDEDAFIADVRTELPPDQDLAEAQWPQHQSLNSQCAPSPCGPLETYADQVRTRSRKNRAQACSGLPRHNRPSGEMPSQRGRKRRLRSTGCE